MGPFESKADAPPSLLERATFATRFAPADPQNKSIVALHQLMVALPRLETHEARLGWLEDLAVWLKETRKLSFASPAGEAPRTQRLRLLLAVLDELPECRAALSTTVREVLANTSSVRLFTETGLPGVKGFVGEAVDRISRRILPEPPDDHDLSQLLSKLFRTVGDARWLESLSADLMERCVDIFQPIEGAPFAPLVAPMHEAVIILAARICAYGLSDEVRSRSPQVPIDQSPFVKLRRAVDALGTEVAGDLAPPEVACREGIGECRRAVKSVVAHLEESGVSLDLVYRLELITKNLDRLYALLGFVGRSQAMEGAGPRFLISLVRGAARDRSLGELLQRNSRQLARKVIERAGQGGEHYITSSNEEYHAMVQSAAGGGLLTTFTTVAKFLLAAVGFPPFFQGLFASLNYAGSFVVMQLMGFTLATKQPSMTAAALAGAIHESTQAEAPDLVGLVDQIARIVRSQLAAVIGNLGMVIPTSVIVDFAIRLAIGRGLLAPEKAEYVVHSLQPFHGPTVPFAALTGVFLWGASVGAGALENWAVYRRLPDVIAKSGMLRRTLGPERAKRASVFFLHHVSGFGGNITLGVLLGMTPAIGNFFGLPLDVRHVTLSTGALTFAALTLGSARVLEPEFLFAVLGIGIIGLLNFGVSFALALTVALRARDVGTGGQLRLLGAVLNRLRKSPWEFFVPPPSKPPDEKGPEQLMGAGVIGSRKEP